MLTQAELTVCKGEKIDFCPKKSLVDIRDITVDKTKSVKEKIEDFAEKVKNPYLFKVGDVAVKVIYNGEKDFSEALKDALSDM